MTGPLMDSPERKRRAAPVGNILRAWRGKRGLSQLSLGFTAGVSARHLSFIETGRSQPSRKMLLRIADALEMPLRDRNALLEAAGYARVFGEADLDAPELAPVRRVLEFLLERHEPYSAVVVDRAWNVLMANRPHERFLRHFVETRSEESPQADNLLHLLFDPAGLRPAVVNWEEVARTLFTRVHRQAMSRPDDPADRMLEQLLAYPGVPRDWAEPDPTEPLELLLPLHLRSDSLELRLVGMITVFGTPQDVTLEELRLETFFPADAATDEKIRSLSDSPIRG